MLSSNSILLSESNPAHLATEVRSSYSWHEQVVSGTVGLPLCLPSDRKCHMDQVILGRLQQLTGSLKPAPGTSADALSALQRHLAQQLVANPSFTVSGNRLQHEAAKAESTVDLSARFSHLSEVLSTPHGAAAAVSAPA